ncbi:MAG: FAD-dependent monooxygenase [Halocynthiibacter sp.]
MPMKNHRITILGAGIGGLAAAVACARAGASVHLLEQAGKIREVGAGIQISPNGVVVLRALGLGPGLERIGLRAGAVSLCDGLTGEAVFGLDLMRLGPGKRYYFVHRADLIGLLAEAARAAGVTLQLLHEVTDIVPEEDGGSCLVTRQGARLRASILIGADGVKSVTRKFLNGTEAPFFTHQVAWRATVPARGDEPRLATVYMGPGRHLVTYPMRGGREMNIVGVEERRDWAAEGWSHSDDPENMRAAFAGFCPEAQVLLRKVRSAYLWGLFRHPVAERWHRGQVALLGDAAHPTLPFLAQGATMALEDAWVLADSLSGADTVEDGLTRYQHRRHMRVERVVNAASKNARNYHLRLAPVRFAAHGALRLVGRVAPGLALARYNWLYGHDVTKAKR